VAGVTPCKYYVVTLLSSSVEARKCGVQLFAEAPGEWSGPHYHDETADNGATTTAATISEPTHILTVWLYGPLPPHRSCLRATLLHTHTHTQPILSSTQAVAAIVGPHSWVVCVPESRPRTESGNRTRV